MDRQPPPDPRRSAGLPAAALVLALAAGAAWWLLAHPPEAPGRPRPPPEVPVVEVFDVQPRPHPLRIHAWGRLRADEVLALRAEVSGRLEALHPALTAAGRIAAGETLYRIDPSEYRLRVREAEAALERARARLEIETGQRRLKQKELEQLRERLRLGTRSLALREPQLREARAAVVEAEARLERARRALARTAPALDFDVRVLELERRPPEWVSAGERIARVMRADRIHARLRVPPGQLPRLRAQTPEIRVHIGGQRLDARLERIEPGLDPDSGQAVVVARLPLEPGAPLPAALGTLIEAELIAGTLPPSLALPASALRDNDHIWVVDAEQRLRVRRARVLHRTPGQVLLAPLRPGDRPLRGHPGGLLPGTRVRVRAP